LGCGAVISGTTVGQSNDYGNDGPDKTYSFTTDEDQHMVFFSTCGKAEFDTVLWVYDNDATDEPTLLVNEDDTEGCDGSTTEAKLPVTGGKNYLIVVDGYAAASDGKFTLTVSCITNPTTKTNDYYANEDDDEEASTTSTSETTSTSFFFIWDTSSTGTSETTSTSSSATWDTSSTGTSETTSTSDASTGDTSTTGTSETTSTSDANGGTSTSNV